MQVTSSSPAQTQDIALALAAQLKPGDLIAFTGDLGAGKTAFVRGLAQGLCSPAHVSSPTFALMHEYVGGRLRIFHFDMYRITDEDALYSTGFFDCLDMPDTVLAVEWSENIAFALEMPHITVAMENTGGETRRITITGDERF